jgi:DNA-binding transcriptional LysR family regulator
MFRSWRTDGRGALEPHYAQVSPTEIGRTYYERSLHILADLDEADRTAGACKRLRGGGFSFIAIRPLRGSSRRS